MARYIYCIFNASFCGILRLRTLFCRDLLNVMFDVPDTAWHGTAWHSITRHKLNEELTKVGADLRPAKEQVAMRCMGNGYAPHHDLAEEGGRAAGRYKDFFSLINPKRLPGPGRRRLLFEVFGRSAPFCLLSPPETCWRYPAPSAY